MGQMQQHQEPRHLDFWAKQLEGSQPAEFTHDKPRSAMVLGETGREEITLAASLSLPLHEYCRTKQTTLVAVLLGAFRAAHFRLTAAKDGTIGTNIASNGISVGWQYIRSVIHENESFESLVHQIQATTEAFRGNHGILSEMVEAETSRTTSLLVRTAFTFRDLLGDEGRHLTQEWGQGRSVNTLNREADLEVHLVHDEKGLRGHILYERNLFYRDTITSTIAIFSEILRQGLAFPRVSIASLDLSDVPVPFQSYDRSTIRWTSYQRKSSIVDIFRRQVDATPNVMAVKDDSFELTYAELDRQSDQVSRWLRQQGLPVESLVGVYMPRSCKTIVAFLGILKASLAYLPLDIRAPPARTETILASVPSDRLLVLEGNTPMAATKLHNVHAVPVQDVLDDHSVTESNHKCASPTATSLAYVMFTSGSTGKPKGVMTEHRGVVRLAKQAEIASMPGGTSVAHLATIAFDASTWEIYTAILNGGTLVCIDAMTVLDATKLRAKFVRDSIRYTKLTPALLQQCLQQAPEILNPLDVLLTSGDRLHPHTALQARLHTGGRFFNAYGPTESTGHSTCFEIPATSNTTDCFANTVPIGQAIGNSGAAVVDAQLRAVPLGVIGELLLTGDGLARGYLDPKQDHNRFIEFDLVGNGKTIRAYRTGDYVRRRTFDGELDFVGRIDHQVKIRGYRVELGEIEHTILRHSAVGDAVALVQEVGDDGPRIVAFVTLRSEQSSLTRAGEGNSTARSSDSDEDNEETQEVQAWTAIRQNVVYADVESISLEKLGHDFVGWTSMYDLQEIDKMDMEEWLQDTLRTIKDGYDPEHVLEIGTGTGMILFNLEENLQSYFGLEPVEHAVNFVKSVAQAKSLTGKVTVQVGTANDVDAVRGIMAPTMAIVNSVAQYFPSPDYLHDVIAKLLRLGTAHHLYFGDIRSYALYRQFQVTMAKYRLGARPSRMELRKCMEQIAQSEKELLVDPAFFTALQDRYPDLIEHVEIIPKCMEATNELSCYRYAAVVHVKYPGKITRTIHQIKDDAWIDFVAEAMDGSALLKRLCAGSNASTVAVSNIPHSKTFFERSVVELLDSEVDDNDGCLDVFAASSEYGSRSLSAKDISIIAEQAGYCVEISWARQFSHHGGFDAIFHRIIPQDGRRVLFAFPTDHQGREASSFTNRPLQFRHQRKMEQHLHRYLQDELPSYMVPTVVRVLDCMPVNENRKVDRHVLTKMNTDLGTTRSAVNCVAPRTDTERVLCEELTAVLGVDVGVTDSFFDLGGHSLMATRAISRINKCLAVDLTIKDLFDSPVVESLGRRVEILSGSAVYKPILPLVHGDSVVQSFAQSRLWFLDQLYPGSTLYIVAYRLRLRGPLDLGALASAFRALQRRHEMLRTTFGDDDGVGTQTVQPYQPHDLLRVIKVAPDNTGARLTDILDQEQSRPFDLRTEPGFRAALFRLGDQDIVLTIDLHHIICDGWSIGLLRAELALFYAAALHKRDLDILPALDIQYRDFAVWQKLPDQLQQQQEQLDYWSRQLEGSQPAEFPCDLPRPSILSSGADAVEVIIEASLFDRVQNYCRAQEVTPFTTLLSAFRATHFRLTGVEDATIGTLVANRNRQELENLIGFFANLQCIRSTVQAGDSFNDLVQQIKTTTTMAFKNQDVPFDKIVASLDLPSRDTSRNPLVQCTFALDSQQDKDHFELEGLNVEPMDCPRPSRFDIAFQLYQEETCFRGYVLYNRDLFRPETMHNLVAVFHKVLSQGLDTPEVPIAHLSLTPVSSVRRDDQRMQLQVQHTDYPRNASIPDVFRQQVALYPNTVAVKDALCQLTYAELDYQSDLLSHWLIRTQKLEAESLVGVYMPRSCRTVVSFLAILKANLAYLPLDVNAPSARIEAILTSVQAARLLLLEDTVASIPVAIAALKHVQVCRVGEAIACEQTVCCEDTPLQQSCNPSATSLAYVKFTSGSTGRPKGVMIEHRGVVRLARQTDIVSRLAVGTKMAHLNTIAFDVSTWETFTAILNGATLMCVDSSTVLDPSTLSKQFMDDCIQVAELPPALLQLCVNDAPGMFAGLEILISAGDRLHPHVAQQVRGHFRGAFFNAYGPTENSGFSTWFEISPDEVFTDRVPIGQPIENSGAIVVDANYHMVPIGVLGELIVTGDGLARGYLDAQQDHDKFIHVTIDNRSVRAYRTGDTVCRRPIDGQLEFFGRIDHQVKIRGYRVELGEVECILRSHKAVDEAVVLVHGSDNGQRLVAFVTLRSGAGSGGALTSNGSGPKEWITEQLHSHVRARLPSYMLPSSIQPLDQFPLNLNRKIDRRALSELNPLAYENHHHHSKLQVSPRNSTEAVLCSILSSILHCSVGATDNFFDLGGHSLLAARVTSRINAQLGANLSIFSFYQTATPATIADLLARTPSSPSAVALPRSYMHIQAREHSKATLVLVHGFWGQGTVFLPLVQLLGEELDVVLIHDPYFGTRNAPGSIGEWAGRYLADLIEVIRTDKPVVLGGFSLGGMIAFQMAGLWQSKFGKCVDSLLLLDAGGYPALTTYFARQEMPTSSLEHALEIFGEKQRELVVEHFEKHRAMSFGNLDEAVFEGDALYLNTPGSSSASWWAVHCPNMQIQTLDCTHYEVLGGSMVGRVAELVRQHYNWK